jgi:hypothetical protein
VIGVHGDALFVSPEDALKLDYPEKYECKVRTMGLIKKEPNKNITGWKVMRESKTGEFIITPNEEPKTSVTTMQDEWSAEEASRILSEKRFNWILTVKGCVSHSGLRFHHVILVRRNL